MIRAVLFDMDGVLLDSEPYIIRAGILMFRERGLVVKKEDFLPFTGMGEDRFLGGVAEKYGEKLFPGDKERTYQIYGQIVEAKLESLPGVDSFIRRARERGLKLAVATSADKIKLDINLKEIGLDNHVFDVTVHGMEVQNRKPAPDIFLLAAEKLGVPPGTCLVVEDAPSGVKAAKKAGARCLALTTSFNHRVLAEADWIAATLAEAPDEVLDW